MDISDTLTPNSDQLDACDLTSGPRIFTVKSVSKGDPEQPVQVHLVEFPRGPWRPGKNMRRVLAACWSANADTWVGRRVELYCDPAVRYGADAVGGTRIRALSHIDGQQKVPLIVSRGKSAVYTVQPLALNAPEVGPSAEDAVGSRGGGPYVGDSATEPAFGASTNSTGGGERSTAASESESPAPQESLKAAINRQIRSIQIDEDGGAYLRTWADSVGVAPSSGAIAEKFGEAARDLRGLMGTGVAS